MEEPLLGRLAIEALNTVAITSAVHSARKTNHKQTFDPTKEMKSLFQGLGIFGKDYTIPQRKDAKPYSIPMPRREPLSLMKETQKELTSMETIRVMSRVEEPTEWCSSIVVVPKNKVMIKLEVTSGY